MATLHPETLPEPLPDPDPDPEPDPATSLFHQLKEKHGLYFGREVGHVVRALPSSDHIVEGLIPPRSVNLLVGDSGVGKTPLAYQLALAVAAGAPFLGLPVRAAKVLLVDYENALWDAHWLLEQQRKHLGLSAYPANFLLWPLHLGPLSGRWEKVVDQVIQQLGPDLVILDSLRSYNPAMETQNRTAARQIRMLRATVCSSGASLLLVHHVRKQTTHRPLDIEQGQALDWLLGTAGARALINQTDVRLALAARSEPARTNGPRNESGEEVTLVLRGHYRTRGEVGPFLLRRRWDADGEPLGYERLRSDPSMLENPEQQAVYQRLPESFRFNEACRLYGRQSESTIRFLRKLIELGLVRKVARGQYRKEESAPEAGLLQ